MTYRHDSYPPSLDVPPSERHLVHADGREWTKDELRKWATDNWSETELTQYDVELFVERPCLFLGWRLGDGRLVVDSDDMAVSYG